MAAEMESLLVKQSTLESQLATLGSRRREVAGGASSSTTRSRTSSSVPSAAAGASVLVQIPPHVSSGQQLQVTLPDGTVPGDTITLTVTQPDGTSFDVTELVPSDWNGTDAVELTVPALQDGDYSAIATVTDANGDTTPASAVDTFTVDRTEVVTPDSPSIAIAEAEPDDLVNAAEAADGVQVQVTVPEGTVPGDTITLTFTPPVGQDIVVEQTIPTTWNGEDAIEMTVPAFFEGTYTGSATVTNSDGQTSPASVEDSFILDKTAPGADSADTITAPQLAISEAQGDNIVDASEAADGVQVQVTVPEDTVAGDVITLTVSQPNGNDFIVTETVPADWNGEDAIEISVPAFFEGDYSATATITNADGQESAVSNNADFNLDKTAPGEDSADTITEPNIAIAEAAGDGIVDASEALDGVQVQVVQH